MKLRINHYTEITPLVHNLLPVPDEIRYFICPDAFEDWFVRTLKDPENPEKYFLIRDAIPKEEHQKLPTVEDIIKIVENIDNLEYWDITQSYTLEEIKKVLKLSSTI